MPKSAPTVTNTPSATAALGDIQSVAFRENSHRGHELQRVGSFRDKDSANQPYEVWYCSRDHILIVV